MKINIKINLTIWILYIVKIKTFQKIKSMNYLCCLHKDFLKVKCMNWLYCLDKHLKNKKVNLHKNEINICNN